MTPQHVISQLLESDTKYPKNLDLLKKIILTAYLGRFRVNGSAPDNKITLGNYLFDEERVMFDYTRLNDEKRKLFLHWLIGPHQNEKTLIYFSDVHINEYRGFTSEVALSWWGRLISWFENRHSEHWKITDLNLSLNYQLTGVEMCHGKNGSLIGFNQFLVPPSGTKYKNTNDAGTEAIGNTKRVFITDKLVDQLTQINLRSVNFEYVCKTPHPQAVEIIDFDSHHKEMHHYRHTQKFVYEKPWYTRLWNWFISFFYQDGPVEKGKPVDNNLKLLYENETVKIYERDVSKEILVREKRPDINDLVLCGGGGKIFAHIGVWKALTEAKIIPENFAGSSAGAIMSLFCYLGYTEDEITGLFKHYKQEHLVFFDIDWHGLSDAHSLKTALDYAIALKVKEIVTTYDLPYPEGKITFLTLDTLRKKCPGCGIGKELIVTATNKRLRQTQYFSLAISPTFEVSEAVKISASLPIVYRSTTVDNDELMDGGPTSNLPTEAFPDDHSTFLETEHGNNFKVLAVQFDNGTERSAIDRTEKVYRENFFLNWLYSLLTGISDPATSWEQDRMKLRKYASQSIVINVENVSTSSFTVDEDTRNRIIQNGYEATKDYLDVRYEKNEKGGYENLEYMYSSFNSLGDLLAYCCYRGDKRWFDKVNDLIVQSSLPNRAALMKQSLELNRLYFKTPMKSGGTTGQEQQNPVTFFGNAVPQEPQGNHEENHNHLLAIYPIFLRIHLDFVKNNGDKSILEAARHSISLLSPLNCLKHLNKITGPVNIVLHIFIQLIRELKENPGKELYRSFEELRHLIYCDTDLLVADYYNYWDLSIPQCLRVLKLFNSNQSREVSQLLKRLATKEEPMQTIVSGVFYDDFNEGSLEEDSGFSM